MIKENENITYDKIKNGFIVCRSWNETNRKDYEYKTEKIYYKTAKETIDAINAINKKIIK